MFCLTDRSNKIMLNGVHIGYLDSKMTAVKEWHPERAPKTWEKPGKKVCATAQKRREKTVPQEQQEMVSEAAAADERYQRVMAELDRKYDEMMKRLDERIKIG